MSRKRCRRRVYEAVPPRGLRPRLAADQLRDLAMAHTVNLDAISRGEANEALLFETIGCVCTWLRAAELLGLGVDDMLQQRDVVLQVLARFQNTGRILFTGPEYQLAKRGVLVMDALAEAVDLPTAIAAANWGEAQMHDIAALHEERQQP